MARFHLSNSKQLRIKISPNMEPDIYKPKGFWYDIDLDWVRWVLGEGYENDSRWMRPYLYEVTVDEARLLRISDISAFDKFCADYYAPAFPEIPAIRQAGIDWQKLKSRFSGLEIAPYLWERRLSRYNGGPDCLWYYGWDCASGVIWDPSAICMAELIADTEGAILKFYGHLHPDE